MDRRSKKAKYGKNTRVHPTAIIGDHVDIGDNCIIFPYTVIGTDPEYKGKGPSGFVVIGDNCIIREFVTVNLPAKYGFTIIGNDAYLMAHSHIGHDSIIGTHFTLSTGARVGGESFIGNWCTVGLNAVLHQRSVLKDFTMIGASSFFKGEAAEGIIWAGVPARPLKINRVGLDRGRPVNRSLIEDKASSIIDQHTMRGL